MIDSPRLPPPLSGDLADDHDGRSDTYSSDQYIDPEAMINHVNQETDISRCVPGYTMKCAKIY
jgi:hypothetical protein